MFIKFGDELINADCVREFLARSNKIISVSPYGDHIASVEYDSEDEARAALERLYMNLLDKRPVTIKKG